MPRFKSIKFCQNRPEIKLVLQKKIAQSPSAEGSAPKPPRLRRLRALPLNPQWPTAAEPALA